MGEKYPGSATFGSPDGTFISHTREINELLSQALSRTEIATKLGIDDPAFLRGDLIRIDLTPKALKNLNLRLPTGKEVGANKLYVSGGETVGKITERVVNGTPKQGSGVSTRTIKP